MKARYFTVTIHRNLRARRKPLSKWAIYARLSILALAAMLTARLLLLMIDVIQAGVGFTGAVSIPFCAGWLIFTGWKLREWTAVTTKEETEICDTESAPSVELTLTPEKSATASRSRAAAR